MNKKTFHVISNTHWDREWRYPYQKNRQMLVDMVDSVLEILSSEPDYRAFHLDSQSIVLKDYLEIKPEKKEKIIEFVKEKRLLIGPWYILPDEYQVGGENLIRNLLLGHKTCEEHGGVSKIGYSPFSWGQISQLPQIYKQFQIDLIMFYRGVNSIDSPKSEFIWEGADGTKMVTSRFSTMPRYNFYFYIYRPVIHNEQIGDVEYKWPQNEAMPFHFADKKMYLEDYSIIRPKDSYYIENIKPSVESIIKDQAEDFTTEHVIWMEGHDSSGPNIKTVNIIKDIRKLMPQVNVIHSTLEEYAKSVLKSVNRSALRVVKGERRSAQYDRRSGNLYGYTTSARMYLKQKNFEAEKWLQYYAEPYNVISSLLGRDIKDNYIEIAWEKLIENSAHDSIGGCSLDEIHEDMMNRYKNTIEISKGVYERAIKHITKSINSDLLISNSAYENDSTNLFLTVYNPNNYERNEILETYIDIPASEDKGNFDLIDSNGKLTKISILEKVKCQPVLEQLTDRPMYFEMHRYRALIEVSSIPAFGFKQYRIIPTKKVKENERIKKQKSQSAILENEFLKVKINKDGSLNIKNKIEGTEIKNTGFFLDEGEAGHAWTHEAVEPVKTTLKTDAVIKKIEDCPLRTKYLIRHNMLIYKDLKSRKGKKGPLVKMPIDLEVSLDKNSRHISFDVEVNNPAESHRLRMMFPTGLKAEYSFGEGQFDVVKRSTERPDTTSWVEQPMYDYPMHHFVDLTDDKNGCAVLTEGLKEYEVLKDKKTLAITLFRAFEFIIAPSSEQDYTYMKGSQSLGKQNYHIAIYPHKGNYVEGQVYEEALNFSNSLSLVQSGKGNGTLSPNISFIEITPKDLVFSALKKSEDPKTNSFIIRLYNPTEEKVEGTVKSYFNILKAEETTLEEKVIKGIKPNKNGEITFSIDKKKILTLLLHFDNKFGDPINV
ncbi:MAG: glycoside hydrolase family 38 C-terminal domain-containing protein [Bacteroidota bacterium]|nr:glycoside hydrolase family 38 C-terminal domain-containing protein [Bacteroidota bacterium]MDP4196078.1 glycoside hydrolase family 38 C-terminal domain-containing protein [Bacteroidota bacterium]